MCNLYSLRKGPATILALARPTENRIGNLEGDPPQAQACKFAVLPREQEPSSCHTSF
jgi:hypothetical protein